MPTRPRIDVAGQKDMFLKIEIANYLRLSKSAVSMIIKSDKSGD